MRTGGIKFATTCDINIALMVEPEVETFFLSSFFLSKDLFLKFNFLYRSHSITNLTLYEQNYLTNFFFIWVFKSLGAVMSRDHKWWDHVIDDESSFTISH